MAGLGNLLWIGGGQGSGKTSIGLALSRRFDLQLYNVDRRTWAHVARAGPSAFMSLSLDERWVYPEPAQMLEWFVAGSAERIPLVLEDLARLPLSPIAVVEGPQLLPSLVAPLIGSPSQALFLIPEPGRQRARLLERGGMTETSDPGRARANAVERDLMISDRIATEAAALGLPTLTVDRPLDEMIQAATTHFEPRIGNGPEAADLSAVRRIENQAVYEQVLLYRASGEARPEDMTGAITFACECGTSGCSETTELQLHEYAAVTRVLCH